MYSEKQQLLSTRERKYVSSKRKRQAIRPFVHLTDTDEHMSCAKQDIEKWLEQGTNFQSSVCEEDRMNHVLKQNWWTVGETREPCVWT